MSPVLRRLNNYWKADVCLRERGCIWGGEGRRKAWLYMQNPLTIDRPGRRSLLQPALARVYRTTEARSHTPHRKQQHRAARAGQLLILTQVDTVASGCSNWIR